MGRVKPARGSLPGGRASRPRPAHAAPAPGVGCAVITVSDTRTAANDPGGDLLHRLLEGAGHRVVRRAHSRDEVRGIRGVVRKALGDRGVDVVLLTGGTGIAERDRTPEAVRPLLDLELPGFGELFRMLSYDDIGSAAYLSRAAASVARGKLLFILPGSPPGVELAMRALVLPELGHALRLLGRTRS